MLSDDTISKISGFKWNQIGFLRAKELCKVQEQATAREIIEYIEHIIPKDTIQLLKETYGL